MTYEYPSIISELSIKKGEKRKQFNFKGKLNIHFRGCVNANNLEEAKKIFLLDLEGSNPGLLPFINSIEIEEIK